MSESESSETETVESSSSEDNSENEAVHVKNSEGKPVQYEMERLKRIEENKRRMEALGLHKMANSVMGSFQTATKQKYEKKGRKKMVKEDEEYNPNDEERSSSDEEDESDEEISRSRNKKAKKNTSNSKKNGSAQKLTMMDSDFVDDDDNALMQAIALSLQDSVGFLDVKSNIVSQHSDDHHKNIPDSETSDTNFLDASSDKRNKNHHIQGDLGKRKRKKPIVSRVQMSEDEVLIHFLQFDETGNGGFTLRDVHRLATAHDFTWSEKEMADMIHFFDSDGDGKISFDDFLKIVCRCSMLKSSDHVATGK